MRITVNDCLGLDAFSSGILVGAKKNTDNRIRSVSVMDAQNVETAIEQNGIKEQMVLTSFYGMEDSEDKQRQVVEGLARRGVGALAVFHVSKKSPMMRGKLDEIGQQAGLPIVIIPAESKVEYSDAIEQIMDSLLYGDSFKNGLINNTIYHLLNFEKHKTFETAIRKAAISNEFQMVLLSKDFNPLLTVETRQIITVADAIKLGKSREFDSSGKYTFVDVDGVITYWGTISINGDKCFLLLVDNEDNYSQGEMTKLAEIIELAIGMWKYSPERDVKAEFIKALIRNNKSLAYSLRDEMDIKADDILSVFHARGIDTKYGNDVIHDYEKQEKITVLRLDEGDATYGIVLRDGKIKAAEEDEPEKMKCLRLYDKLKAGQKGVRIFHATGIDGIEGAGDAFRLIGETWPFVESVFPYKRVFTKYELALVSNCINLQVQGGYMKKTYMDLLEPFRKEVGENKAKQLLETLETFVLDAGMNSGKTSEFMGIHTNTVQYRLKKINDILGAEITGNRVIPGLTMALALKRLDRVVK